MFIFKWYVFRNKIMWNFKMRYIFQTSLKNLKYAKPSRINSFESPSMTVMVVKYLIWKEVIWI